MKTYLCLIKIKIQKYARDKSFYGIVIYMYVSEHNPPHFHVWYNDYKAIVTIEEGIVKGSIPRRALTLVYEWLDLHKRELMENWELLREFKSPNKLNLWNNMDDILTIKSASYVGDYSIVAEFSNGETRLLDFSELVTSGRGMLKMLADKEYFRHFTLDPFTIDWNNEIGFEPEYLYAMSKPLPKYYADNVKHDMVAEEVHRG